MKKLILFSIFIALQQISFADASTNRVGIPEIKIDVGTYYCANLQSTVDGTSYNPLFFQITDKTNLKWDLGIPTGTKNPCSQINRPPELLQSGSYTSEKAHKYFLLYDLELDGGQNGGPDGMYLDRGFVIENGTFDVGRRPLTPAQKPLQLKFKPLKFN